MVKTKIIEKILIAGLIFPPIGTAYSIYLAINDGGIATPMLALFISTSLLTHITLEMGFHRYFSHHSFKAHSILKHFFIIVGSMTYEGTVPFWVGTHRAHHFFADTENDPHSPIPKDNSVMDNLKGYWHAYFGWLFNYNKNTWVIHAKDLKDDPMVKKYSCYYPLLLLLGLIIPAVIGGILLWSSYGAQLGFLWGGLVRIFFVQQINFISNVILHCIGQRTFNTNDNSTNVPWLLPLTLGHSWHNNHHAYPRAAILTFKWWQLDVIGLVILLLEKIGLVWDVYIPKPDKIDNIITRLQK